MSRMKTFFIYALLVVAVLLLTDVIINLCLNSNYREIKKYEIATNSPKIEITEARKTYMNGYIGGTVTNNTGSNIEKSYIKIELLTDLGNLLGTEYLKIDGLQENETKQFRLSYRYSDVDSFVISTVDEVVEEEVKLSPLIAKAELYFTIAKFIAWAALPPFYLISAFVK